MAHGGDNECLYYLEMCYAFYMLHQEELHFGCVLWAGHYNRRQEAFLS